MKGHILLSKIFTIFMFFTRISLCKHTIKYTNVIRGTIVFNEKMPSLYMDVRNYPIDENYKNSIYSMEHILPRSFLEKHHYNDMHNIARTVNEINIQRSNYMYTDELTNNTNWIKLSFDNYVNHKYRLFIPNKSSRGFISRSLLYMAKEYNYDSLKIINKDLLIQWFYEHPPDKLEKYHNEVVAKLQNKNNVFISQYNKKSKTLLKFMEKM